LRVALVILHADPARGGAERYTVDLAAALAKRGHEVSLVATTFSPQLPSGAHRVPLATTGVTRTRRYWHMLDALDAHLRETSYDIVHAMLPVRRCDVYHPHAGMAAGGVSEKSLTAVFNPRRRAMAEVERELLTSADPPVLLSLSEYVKKDILRYYPKLPAERLVTLFNAVDLDHFTPTARSTDRKVNALFVGQDFARKGLLQAAKAVSDLREHNVGLTVVGKSKVPFGLPPQHKQRVKFVGNVEDTRPYYRDADFLVLPTRHDPCSLVVLEALAMGLPVISTRFNGACEIMTDGVHGFILPDPNDVRALTDAMRKMLDPELRRRMSAACLELRPRLSYEHHLDRLMTIYEDRIAQRRRK
jgi:UDP-glucose:(heptosyl)LPS alpha-1,3-glucosyltransferase